MNLLSLFPTTVGISNQSFILSKEEKEFLLSQETRENMFNTTSVNTHLLDDPILKDLKFYIEQELILYFQTIYQPKFDVKPYITQSWTNYTKPGESHHKHIHPNSFISGVLYIQTDNDRDKIHFYKNENKIIKIITENWNISNSEAWWVPVKEGNLIFFPSSLEHNVEKLPEDKSNKTRISLAFNTFLKGQLGESLALNELLLGN